VADMINIEFPFLDLWYGSIPFLCGFILIPGLAWVLVKYLFRIYLWLCASNTEDEYLHEDDLFGYYGELYYHGYRKFNEKNLIEVSDAFGLFMNEDPEGPDWLDFVGFEGERIADKNPNDG